MLNKLATIFQNEVLSTFVCRRPACVYFPSLRAVSVVVCVCVMSTIYRFTIVYSLRARIFVHTISFIRVESPFFGLLRISERMWPIWTILRFSEMFLFFFFVTFCFSCVFGLWIPFFIQISLHFSFEIEWCFFFTKRKFTTRLFIIVLIINLKNEFFREH